MRHGLVATIVAVGLLASGGASASTEDQPVTVTTLEGYELQDSPALAIEYAGNTNIFFGEVTGHGDPRKVSRANEAGDQFSYIYVPINVRVIHVFKGDRAMTSDSVIVRALGGQLGDERTVSRSSAAPGAYQKGMKLYLFTTGFLDAGDGLVATTPNFAYAQDTVGNVYSLQHPDQKAPAASFPVRISEIAG